MPMLRTQKLLKIGNQMLETAGGRSLLRALLQAK